jgi:glyceraldehyde 3-phosphate dehydrogenase
MTCRIGIMGFGRIGRNIFRILHQDRDLQVAAIVDTAAPEALEYLLRFDTVHGRFSNVALEDGVFYSDGRSIPLLSHARPEDVDWKALDVDYVVEATGRYRTRAQLEGHLAGGVARVILASPPESLEDVDRLLIAGVNDAELTADDRIISLGSCTLGAVGPVLKLLHENFGVGQAYMNSIHAYTNRMRLADVPSEDFRASRAAAENIIPSTTYTPNVIGRVIPELEGRLQGLALNVPVPDGSCVDLTVFLEKPTSAPAINAVMRSAAAGSWSRVLEYSEDPIVSSDVVGNPHSAIYDGLATIVLGDSMAKLLIWYDNGWGYAERIVDTISHVHAVDEGRS